MKLIDELYDTIRFVNETPNAVFDMDKIEDIFAAIEDKLRFYEKIEQALEIIKENRIEGLTLEWDGTWWTVCVPNYPFPIAYGRKKEEYDLLKEVLE